MHDFSAFLWFLFHFLYFSDIILLYSIKILIFSGMTKSKNSFNFFKSKRLNALLLFWFIRLYICLLLFNLLNSISICYTYEVCFLNNFLCNFVWFFGIVHTSLVQSKYLSWLQNALPKYFGVLYLYSLCNMIQAI